MRTADDELLDERRVQWPGWKVPEKKLEPREHQPIPRGAEYGLEPLTTEVPSATADDAQMSQPW